MNREDYLEFRNSVFSICEKLCVPFSISIFSQWRLIYAKVIWRECVVWNKKEAVWMYTASL
jgi:hypothetical protein